MLDKIICILYNSKRLGLFFKPSKNKRRKDESLEGLDLLDTSVSPHRV
jgi:hypothetical protein